MALLEKTHHTQSQPSQNPITIILGYLFRFFLKLCKGFLKSPVKFLTVM